MEKIRFNSIFIVLLMMPFYSQAQCNIGIENLFEQDVQTYSIPLLQKERATVERDLLLKLINIIGVLDSTSLSSYLVPFELREELSLINIAPSISLYSRKRKRFTSGTLNNFFPNESKLICEDTMGFMVCKKKSTFIIFYCIQGDNSSKPTEDGLRKGVTYYWIFDFSLSTIVRFENYPNYGSSVVCFRLNETIKVAENSSKNYFLINKKLRVKDLLRFVKKETSVLNWASKTDDYNNHFLIGPIFRSMPSY